jgi:hypothetical protein
MIVVLPVKRRLPLIGCRDVKTRHFHLRDRLVVLVSSVRRFLGQGVDVLDDFDPGHGLGDQTGFLAQLPLGGLRCCLAGLNPAGDDVPVRALLR